MKNQLKKYLLRNYARIHNIFASKNNRLEFYFFFSRKQDDGNFDYDKPKNKNYFKGSEYSEMCSIFKRYEHLDNKRGWSNWDDAILLGMGNHNDIAFNK